MRVQEIMSRFVSFISPDETIRNAAQTMDELDSGILPVGTERELVGIVTDRDIALRGVAKGLDGDCKVTRIMTAEVVYCFDDEDVSHVLDVMAALQLRRLPVLDRTRSIVGIVSLGDAAAKADPSTVGRALSGIGRRGGQGTEGGH